MCSNMDPMKLKEFSLSLEYPTLKNEELCKYSYVSWCPTCENTNHRRSQSECLEPCKKKSREMKAPNVKRYLDNQEYENMDFDFDVKDSWFDQNHQKLNQVYDCCRFRSTMNGTIEQKYYDCCSRIRSNLCELPTSYIRNTSCQNQSLSTLKMSDTDKNFVECLENRVKSYEKSIKCVDYSENTSILDSRYDSSKNTEIFDDKLQRDCGKLVGIHSEVNGSKNDHLEEHKNAKRSLVQFNVDSRKMSDFQTLPQKTYLNMRDNHYSGLQDDKYCQTESKHSYSVDYDTETYFDKLKKEKIECLSNLYAQEMNNLKEKLKELRNSAYKNSTSAEMVAESLAAKDKEMEEKQSGFRIMKDSPKMLRRSKSRMLRVKTRGSKVINTVKIRRYNSRAMQTTKTPSVESEGIQSDYSDSDESIKETEEDVQAFVTPLADSTSKEVLNVDDAAASGDSTVWPVRESLFPNVPPYIAFNSFNVEEPRLIPIGRKYFKWKLSTITPVLVRKVISNTGFVMVRKSNQWLGTWGKHIKAPMFKTLKDSQKLNHFPGTFQLGRKDRLWRNFQRMMNTYGYKEFGFLPHTYVLPHELKLLKYNWENKNSGTGEWWIIKPPASARGVGIKVINKWGQLPKKTSLVVQKYITNPYLINGSKFDLRLYVLVTSFHPLRVYLYTDGLVRFASVKYSNNAKDIKEKYMHLTNYSINKLSSNYTANEDAHSAQGHKWTITKLLEYLNKEGVDTRTLWKNLEMLVIKTIIACESPITELCTENINTRYNCYELFGIDVLLDEKLKPWLLEVNISPSLHSSSPLDEHVKGPMVQSLFNMVQFHFPSRLATMIKPNLKCYEPKLYTTHLTHKETSKHEKFKQMKRLDYLDAILEHLTGDDIRHLIQAEDELRVKDKFKKIFPTSSTHTLLDFMEPRYYNRLFDAWETKYEKNREEGIQRLQTLCSDRMHLKGATLAGIQKNGRNTSHGVKSSRKAKSPQKEVKALKDLLEFTEVQEEGSIVPSSK